MQKVKLPLKVDAMRAAQKRLNYDGIIKAELLARLAESTESVISDANVTLSFDLDQRHLAFLRGHAEVEVMLACQRCQEGMPQTIHADFCYSPVQDPERIEDLPEAYEPAEVDEFGEIDLIQIIEDELILALPQIPMHDDDTCFMHASDISVGVIPEAEERPNPFAVLKSLKK